MKVDMNQKHIDLKQKRRLPNGKIAMSALWFSAALLLISSPFAKGFALQPPGMSNANLGAHVNGPNRVGSSARHHSPGAFFNPISGDNNAGPQNSQKPRKGSSELYIGAWMDDFKDDVSVRFGGEPPQEQPQVLNFASQTEMSKRKQTSSGRKKNKNSDDGFDRNVLLEDVEDIRDDLGKFWKHFNEEVSTQYTSLVDDVSSARKESVNRIQRATERSNNPWWKKAGNFVSNIFLTKEEKIVKESQQEVHTVLEEANLAIGSANELLVPWAKQNFPQIQALLKEGIDLATKEKRSVMDELQRTLQAITLAEQQLDMVKNRGKVQSKKEAQLEKALLLSEKKQEHLAQEIKQTKLTIFEQLQQLEKIDGGFSNLPENLQKLVAKKSPSSISADTTAPIAKPPTTTDWSKMTVVQLRTELKDRKLPTKGRKGALVARLEEAELESLQALTTGNVQPARKPKQTSTNDIATDTAKKTILDWSKLTVRQLRAELKNKGLKVGGKKQELMDRLTQASVSA